MKSKLTLTVEKTVIEKAKSHAKKTDRSLSELVEKFLEELTNDESTHTLSNKLSKIVGAVKLPVTFNEKEELDEYYKNRDI